ncbi:MAG: hypothetical protein HYY63_05235 [Elusimicrobia bacterium]|nr:hypothetical protein [Elusimicrobiota bacterium]
MSVTIKTIYGKKYAYLAQRRRRRIVQEYLGPLSDSKTAAMISILKREKEIPKRYRFYFWDTAPHRIHLYGNRSYIIERILEYGDMDAFRWIQKLYPTKVIIESCLTSKRLSPKTKNFWPIWFGIRHVS